MRHLPGAELQYAAMATPTVYIDGTKLSGRQRLQHGARILFGRSHLFRYYNPAEARLLKSGKPNKRGHVRSQSFTTLQSFGRRTSSDTGAEFHDMHSVSQRRDSLLGASSYNADDYADVSFESTVPQPDG